MEYRPFGKSGLKVSEVVIGGGYVGGILIDPDDAIKREALRRAFAAGVNWIDTAPDYGNGQSETNLGRLLPELKEDQQPYLSTKVRLDPNNLGDISGQVEASIYASLKKLNRQSVDLLQLHNAINPVVTNRAVALKHALQAADCFERLREQGLIRFIGYTALGNKSCCIAAANSGRFDSAQVYYNLINPSASWSSKLGWDAYDFSGLMAACEANGVAIMNIRVFAAGVLVTETRHGRELQVTGSDIPSEEALTRRVMGALGLKADGSTPYGTRSQAAIRFALSEKRLACSIIGIAELSHLDQAVAAPDMGSLPNETLAILENLYNIN
jgi:L-galactose dehydrogenase/L-glyceraldehyde 3-phosphate reductase